MDEIIVVIHIGILIITAVAILSADIYASGWLKGKKLTLNPVIVQRLHKAVTIGLSGMLATGIMLFWPLREHLVSGNTAFTIKMIFVFALVVNSLVIESYMKIATTTAFKDIPFGKKSILFASGAVSLLSWIGATLAAFQLLSE